jgi:hypothetical protein
MTALILADAPVEAWQLEPGDLIVLDGAEHRVEAVDSQDVVTLTLACGPRTGQSMAGTRRGAAGCSVAPAWHGAGTTAGCGRRSTRTASTTRSTRRKTEMHTEMPPAWADLIEGLTLLAKHQNNDLSPFNCQHDELTVMADPAAFTGEEIARLEELGFNAGTEGTFCSFRFGSA